MKDHKEWIENRLGKSVHAVALELNEDPSNFSKKVRRGLTTDHIIQIARAFEIPIVQALQETGIIGDGDMEPESPERIAETISYLAKKLAVQAHPKEEKPAEQNNVVQLPSNDVAHDFYSDEIPEDAVAYPHKELGGSLDDLDP
ncbi:hypothetical protein ACGE24_03965 [Corynebacterium kroppenstedtii]|uniref:hypothetical protein n=1 Tax=Corynebacterium sp. PCR 32 TaxID=3351342 RepID=UPI0030ABA871